MLIWITLFSIFVSNIVGVGLHFTHRKKTRSLILHLFSAVNESTWEHLKLAFIPMLIISFIQYFLFKNEYMNILESNLYAILITIFLIPTLYYPIRYFLKEELLFVSISLFILSVILGYTAQYFFLLEEISIINEYVSFLLLISLFLLFSFFTFFPPKVFLFKDPVTNTYGHLK